MKVTLEEPQKTDNQHGNDGHGVRNKDGETIREIGAAMNMTVENTLFKNRASHLVTNESGQSKIQVDFLQKRTLQRNLLKDIIVLLSEQCIT